MNTIDWDNTFLPAVIALLNGQPLPQSFYNPIWVLFPLIPFALLPYEIGRTLMQLCALGVWSLIGWKLKAKPIALVAFVLSPLVLASVMWGNVEWLALLGLILPSPINVLMLLIKPQITFIPILYLTWQAYREKQFTKFAIIPSIAIAVMLASGWLGTLSRYSHDAANNFSLFPFSLLVGIPLVLLAFKRKQIRFAIASSPCFALTLSPQSWLVSLCLFLPSYAMVMISIILWLVVLAIGL